MRSKDRISADFATSLRTALVLSLAIDLLHPRAVRAVLDCPASFQQSYLRQISFEELLDLHFAELPGLRQVLELYLQDPLTPASMRNFIEKALEDPNLTISKLTEEVRRSWKIPPTTHSFAEFSPYADFNPFFFYDHTKAQTPQHFSEAKGVAGRTGNRYQVMLSDAGGRRLSANSIIQLSRLIHELAHVRFYGFLARNREKLLAKLPASRYQRTHATEERYWFDQSFFSYLSERYAFEQERRFLLSQPSTPEVREARRAFARLFLDERGRPESDLDFDLSKAVRISYGRMITDPRIAELDRLSLAEILRGKAREWPARTVGTELGLRPPQSRLDPLAR